MCISDPFTVTLLFAESTGHLQYIYIYKICMYAKGIYLMTTYAVYSSRVLSDLQYTYTLLMFKTYPVLLNSLMYSHIYFLLSRSFRLWVLRTVLSFYIYIYIITIISILFPSFLYSHNLSLISCY